jgi:hypothetical protein
MMAVYAQDAVGHAEASSGVALDYSLGSIWCAAQFPETPDWDSREQRMTP